MKRIAIFLLLVGSYLGVAYAGSSVTTVILVRHAEKIVDPAVKDPPLSAGGEERARELARVLGSARIDVIYTTPYARTRQTAAPLASVLGLKPVETNAGLTYASEMAARIKADHAGATLLLVGHSNTTPQVIRELGIADAPFIPESRYDDLFIVTLAPESKPRLLMLRYGAPAR